MQAHYSPSLDTPGSHGKHSVSVIIPAHNAAEFIAHSLDSVCGQTLRPDEILVVDDGSSDDTAAIAEAYAPLVRVIRRPHSGQSASINHAVEEARCEWIALNDADDLWEPNKLELQIAQLLRQPQADFCYTSRIHFEHDTIPMRHLITLPAPRPAEIRQALYRNTAIGRGSVLMRRSLFLRNGGFDPHFVQVQDWEFWLRLLHAGAVFTACPEPLLLCRIHAENISNNGLRALDFQEQIYRRHIMAHIPRPRRWFAYLRFRSEHEALAAMKLRTMRDPQCVTTMFQSILHDPFHYPLRYKIFVHMLAMLLLRGRPWSNSSSA